MAKLFLKGREAQLGMIKPTLTNPDAIIEIESGGKKGEEVERETKLLFVKTFLNKNGKKVHYFTSVTVRKEGMEVSVSNHIETEKRIRRFLKEGKLLYRVYGGAQTEQTQPSASVTTSQDDIAGSSEGKDNKNPSNGNEEKQTLTFGDGTPVPMLEDGNPDFSKMTAGQTAELYDAQFGEDADQILSSSVTDAKKSLDKAKGKPIRGKNFLELAASKSANDKAVAEAQAAYDNAKSVSNAYQEMLIDRSLGTVEGRQTILDKAKRKFDRLKNTDEWKDNQQPLWDETVGKVLHRLYDGTSVDVFDPEPRTVEEYVSSNLAPFSLNYEGSDTAKGVKQETGLERKDFAKNYVLAAEGKGQTVDSFVHKLWMNRPPQLENVTDQDIRNAVIGLITGNMNAYDMRHVIENNRIAEAEKEIEAEQTAAENAAYQEEQGKKAEEVAASAENNTPIEEVPEEGTASTDSEEHQNEQQPEELSPEDAADNMPFGEQLNESDLPFSPNDENKVVGSKERKEMVDKNKVTVDHVSEAFIPKKLQRGIARIAKMMPKVNGKSLTVQYLYSADADGWFDRDTNTLYLALDSSKALQMVFGHEMTHAIKSMNISSYDELKELVKEFLGEDFDKAVDATEQFYNAHGVTYPNREDYEEEVIADGIGTIINDLNLTKGIALRMSHPLLAAFHNILMKIRLAFRLSDDGTYERLTHAVKAIEKAYVDTMKMDAANVEYTTGEQGTAFSIRQKPDPEKTIKCYKLMRLGEDGKLYPLFIDAKAPTELGTWYDGDSPNLEQLKGLPSGVHLVDNETGKVTSFEDWYNEHTDLYKKGNGNITKMGKLPSKEAINWATLHNARFMYIEDTKRGQNRFGGEARKYWNLGINGSGTVSTFSMRPGWHAGSLPTMRQIGKGKDKNLRDDNFVWVEGEISADIDYNEEAQKNPDKDIPNRIPEDGYYLKATNANKSASQADRVGWYVAGAFKANRIMGDAEARKVIDDWNANHPDLPVEYDYERESGMTFNADTMRLEDKDGNPSPKFSLKVYHGSGADFDEFDFDHMGEGAGSQAFGWGGYVTTSKKIGKSYATLMDNDPSRSNVVIRNASARRFIKKYPTLESFLHSMADKDNLTAQEKNINKHFTEQEKIDYYNERAKDAEPYHNMYEVEIPDDNGKNYLEWDKPMTQEQQDIVIDGLESIGIPVTNGFEFELPFHEVYHTVLGMMLRGYGETGGIQKKVSKFLSSLGFTGIKYPAGTIMGGADKGDSNYVIFKPEDMTIASHTKFSLRGEDFSSRLKSAISETDVNPSEAQKQSGNYKKGHIKFGGYDFTIENPKGSERKGVDEDGKEWSVKMHDTYGYIRGKIGKDGDHLDMFINDSADLDNWNGNVYVVDQVNDDGSFDEHKVMYGYNSEADAKKAYLANYSKGWKGLGKITGVDKGTFDKWIQSSDRKTKPFADYSMIRNTDSDIRFSLAGLSGAATADKVEGVITRLANFNIALKMVKDGKDAKAIKMATGWEKGVDGKWRFEMPDAKLSEYMDIDGKGTMVKRHEEDMLWTGGKLGDVVDAPELFKAYPQLKDVELDTDSMTGDKPSNGSYNPNTNTITIHASELKYLNSILNHEIQHAIQQIEGFAKGGNPSMFADTIEYVMSDLNQAVGGKLYDAGGVDNNPDSVFKALNQKTAYGTLLRDNDSNLQHVAEKYGYDNIFDLVEDIPNIKSSYQVYQSLAGEVEARNVEKRMGMSADERRNSLAEETEDVPRGEQRVRFSLKDPGKTMFGMHNISVDKLRKAIKQGGFAAPSMGVVDSKNGVYSDYGEITLIPKAEKLDKRKGKNAGTFTADAWTPTYPQVIIRQTKEGKEKLYTDTMLNDNIPKEIGKNLLNRWESYINTGSSRPSEFAWQYMFEKGMNPKVNYSKSAYPKSISNKVMEITDNGVKRRNELTKEENGELIKLYNAYLEKKGEGLDDNAVKEIIDYLEEWKENEKVGAFKQNLQRKIDYFKEYGGDINKAQDWAWQDVIPAAKSDGKVNHAMTLYYATIKADSDKKMQSDLQKWFDGKLQEYSMEEYLYNGETASGKPKYVPNTVENAVKIMKKQGLAGGYNDFAPGVGAFIAKYAPTANTLAAMKKNKGKLIPSGDERHKEVRDMILDEYNDLARSLTINPSDAFDDSGTYRMQELADVKPKDLKKYIADNWNKEVSDGWVDGYNDLVDIIKNDYPVYYFETKFMRPYGLDEFEKAIVPKNTPTDVMDALKKAGIDVHTYEGKEDREKATMDALAGSDGIMFSLKSMADGSEYAHISLANKLGELTSAKKVDDAIKEAVDNMPSGWKMANKKTIHVAEALADNRKDELAGNAPRFLLRPNTLIKSGTYFSGGGLVEEGLKGIIDPVLAVEYDEKISGVYRNNFGKHIVTADVRDVDPSKLVSQIDGEVEYFHASPVCKNYSNAKLRHEEVELDKETAQSTADFINQVKPRVVTIENVKGYKDSEAMKIITDTLDKNGYKWDADVYNAADYGGYTNRERLIVRALRDGELPEKPKKLTRKSGWYEAVEDIMPTLTEKKNGVAPWMDTRLKADGIDWRNIDKPLYVMGSAYADDKVPHAFADELLPTLRTKSGDVIIMPDGKVYRAQGRVLARVSGMSDDYKLPYSESLAHTIIGNGIPTQLTEHVIAPLLVSDNPKFSIRTYHGSGAKFDSFDLSHAFEGEGSETFGHGVYVTNSGEIGADYAKRAKGKLSNNASFTVNMGSPLANDWFKYFYRMVGNEGFDDAKKYVLDEFDQDIKMYSSALEGLQADDRTRKRKEATLEEMKRLREQIANTKEEDLPEIPHSYRYDVEIPDDNGHNYLYWLAAPSKEVQERILEGFYDLPTSTLDRMAQKDASFRALLYDIVKNVDKKQAIPALVKSNTLTQKSMYDTTVMEDNVGSMYRRFANWFGGADKVSDFLSSLGYTGIKYPAGTIHNGAKEGDYNYVIFNEADAKIVGNTKFSLRYSDYEKALADWKARNGLPKDAKEPIEVPQQQSNESKFDYMLRVHRYLGEKALWKTAPTYEGHLLYGDTAVGYLNSELQRGSILARIAMQDSMLPIKKAQEGIMKELGLDKIGVGEDAYTAENRSHGKGKNEFEEYNQVYLQPLRKSYHAMKKLLGDSYDNVKVYMISKHGLERNAFIAFREALKKDFTTKEKGKKDVFDASGMQKAYNDYKVDINRINNDADYAAGKIDYATYRQNDNAIRTKYAPSYPEYRYDDEGNVRDYAGLSALYADAGKFEDSDFELTAASNVKEVEKAHKAEATALWDATNAATKKILRDSYLAGMMSKSLYDYVKGMYDYYIPLRGWDGTSADQVWDYVGGGRGAFNQAMKTAGGRKSVADDPIAYIENMAESGILLNNKNWVKQHLLLLAENHPTSLLTVSKAWYVKSRDTQGEEIWTISSPKIPADMTDPEKISQAISQFNNDMKTLEAMGEATQKRGELTIEYPQTKGEEREHEMRVLRDGDEYVVYVNGDPQLAQAMNNVRAMRVRENQSGILDRSMAWLGRKMAAAYTSLSPLFIPANFTRDLTMTLASTAIREDGRYNYLLRKNFLTHWNTMPLVIKYQNGKLRQKVEDGSATETEKMFYDFMMNGGETGFVTTMEVEDFKKKIQNELKDMDRWKTNPKRVGHAIMDSIELLNRAIEDSNRFLVYMTSRQYGRPIEEAINNAKDVTLNFNRKGTGEYGWQMVRNLYLFINPAVQSLQTLGALAKGHPYKFSAVTALWLASGVLVPVVNNLLLELFGGDDDKDKYWSFSKWDRRNNFIMWLPGTKYFVKVPLSQEFRGFYSVGDMIASKLMGGEKAVETWSDYAQDFMGLVVDMLPLDPTGYDGNVVVSLMPNAIRPILELAFNVDFTGKPLFNDSEYNKYDPNFTKAYVGTPDWLVRTSKLINSIGNPYPDVQQNAIDRFGNPRYNLNNPAVVDHVLSSYLGGAYTFGSQAVGVLTKALNSDSEIKVADIPLLSRFVGNPDDRPVAKKQGDAFWSMKEQQDRTANTLSKLKKEAKVSGDYSLLEDFFKSDQYAKFKENTPRIKQYEEDKKKEKAEREGEEYKPHKTTGNDIYKNHASSTDDFEDMKMNLLWKKVGSYKTVYDGMVSIGNSQSDSYYTNHVAAIDAADEAYGLRSTINSLKKDMVTDEGKDSYSAENMKQIRELRKQVISILENAAKTLPKPKDK